MKIQLMHAPFPKAALDLADAPRLAPERDALRDILASAPLGLRVETEAGVTIFENQSMISTGATTPGARVHEARFDFQGVSYKLCVAGENPDETTQDEQLFQKAYFDALTGLPNRSFIEQTVEALIENKAPRFALAFIDLDGFKQVNDFYGHVIGDKLLIRISERLASELTSGDMVGRLSGDEFILLISDFGDTATLGAFMEKVSSRLKSPFYIDGFEVLISASMGVCLYPDHGSCFDVLRSNADSAMYRSKSNFKGSVLFFDSTIQHSAQSKARLEHRVRLAIRDRRTCCAYQPKVNFRTGETTGVEALLRWRDEDGVIMPPGEFVGLAIELGLMNGVTEVLVDQIIGEIDKINACFGATSSISVNIAAKQAGDARFMKTLVEKLSETGFAHRFMLEITEEAFLAKNQFQQRILPMIREAGPKVSIDDFGVGYSSLSALADITADELKIDRSFITDIHKRGRNQSIIKAIESLGASLGIRVVVEGVETFEELAYLQAATRINTAQGYYFSKPIQLDDARINESVDDRVSESPRLSVPSRTANARDRTLRRA